MRGARVSLCVVATGKYTKFLEPLAGSLHLFLPTCSVELVVFSDQKVPLRVTQFEVEHHPWPYATLYRYHMMRQAEWHLRESDFVYYMDVDSLVVSEVGEEILGDRVAVRHEGYEDNPAWALPFENRPESVAYVQLGTSETYYAGGFQGGAANVFCDDINRLAQMVDQDDAKGIVPRWHDESVWNRYLIAYPPTVSLSGAYMSCDQKHRPDAKVLALTKPHAEVRA